MNNRAGNPLNASLAGLIISFVPAILWYEILNSDFIGFLGPADDHAAPLIISSILTLVVMAYVLPLIAGAKRWRKAGRVFLLISAALLVAALLFEEDLLAPLGVFVLFFMLGIPYIVTPYVSGLILAFIAVPFRQYQCPIWLRMATAFIVVVPPAVTYLFILSSSGLEGVEEIRRIYVVSVFPLIFLVRTLQIWLAKVLGGGVLQKRSGSGENAVTEPPQQPPVQQTGSVQSNAPGATINPNDRSDQQQ